MDHGQVVCRGPGEKAMPLIHKRLQNVSSPERPKMVWLLENILFIVRRKVEIGESVSPATPGLRGRAPRVGWMQSMRGPDLPSAVWDKDSQSLCWGLLSADTPLPWWHTPARQGYAWQRWIIWGTAILQVALSAAIQELESWGCSSDSTMVKMRIKQQL